MCPPFPHTLTHTRIHPNWSVFAAVLVGVPRSDKSAIKVLSLSQNGMYEMNHNRITVSYLWSCHDTNYIFLKLTAIHVELFSVWEMSTLFKGSAQEDLSVTFIGKRFPCILSQAWLGRKIVMMSLDLAGQETIFSVRLTVFLLLSSQTHCTDSFYGC